MLRQLIVLGIAWLMFAASSVAQDATTEIQAHLSAGEFGPARQLADQLSPANRDQWLSQIATAQASTGARRASAATTFDIQNDGLRSSTFGQLSSQPAGGRPGGAALADFDSLIELITSTIAPESWDTVGGPGAIESFPTGVYVAPDGVLKKLSLESKPDALSLLRRETIREGANREVATPSSLRKVSLTRLERHLEMRWALGKRPTETMQAFAGLERIQYVFFYPETRDIVIAGPASGWEEDEAGRWVSTHTGAPVLRLDDYAVVIRNALSEERRFGCAITPKQANLAAVQAFLAESAKKPLRPGQRERWLDDLQARLGKQEIDVFGIDPRSRAARVVVEADYHMKLIGMGLEEGTPGVESYLENVSVGPDGQPPQMDVLRWWFTLNDRAIRTTPQHDAFLFVGNGVRVQSENEMLTERGERIHTGSSDVKNQQFANDFTRHYDELAKKYPIYADLRNIFDLALVAGLVREQDLSGRIDWSFPHLGPTGPYHVAVGLAPREVDSVINHRLIGRRHLVVGISGGVSVDASKSVATSQLKLDDYQALGPTHASSRPQDIPLTRWWWD